MLHLSAALKTVGVILMGLGMVIAVLNAGHLGTNVYTQQEWRMRGLISLVWSLLVGVGFLLVKSSEWILD